ncbi:MAG: hypothetical protein ACK40L_19740, partial [Hydrogenophaga sp.]
MQVTYRLGGSLQALKDGLTRVKLPGVEKVECGDVSSFDSRASLLDALRAAARSPDTLFVLWCGAAARAMGEAARQVVDDWRAERADGEHVCHVALVVQVSRGGALGGAAEPEFRLLFSPA